MKKKAKGKPIKKFGVTADSLTLCLHCFCMTRTVLHKCGKCKGKK